MITGEEMIIVMMMIMIMMMMMIMMIITQLRGDVLHQPGHRVHLPCGAGVSGGLRQGEEQNKIQLVLGIDFQHVAFYLSII